MDSVSNTLTLRRAPKDGSTVTASETLYAVTASGAQPADSQFSASAPSGLDKGQYLWVLTRTTWSSGVTTKSYAVSRIASDGDTGAGIHLAYASSSNGVENFSTTWFDGAAYLGICVSAEQADPEDPAAYEWSRIQGEKGDNALYLDLDNENDTMLYDGQGNPVSGEVTSQATLYDGREAVTDGVEYSCEATGCEATITAGGKVTVTALTADTASVTVTATYKGSTLAAILSLKKLTGADKYELVLSNSCASVNADGNITPKKIFVKVYRTAQNGGRTLADTLPDGCTLYADDLKLDYVGGSGDFYTNPNLTRHNVTLSDADGNTLDSETVPVVRDGKAGADAKIVTISGEQVMKYAAGFTGTPSPSSITLSAALQGVTGCQWSYKAAGGTDFTDIDGATAAACTVAHDAEMWGGGRTLTLRCTSGGVSDEMTLVKIADGDNAYTVLLTNESHVFAADTAAALASSVDSYVKAYKGTEKQVAEIGTISGCPAGMTASTISNKTNHARVRISVTSELTTKSGTLTVPVTVDGLTFNRIFSWSLSLKGEQGDPGQGAFKSFVFLRSAKQPDAPEGGSYGSPVPDGWSDGIPAEDGNPCYMTSRTFTSDGESPQDDAWATPQLCADTSDFDICFHAATTDGQAPAAPGGHGEESTGGWHETAAETDEWMATSSLSNGKWGEWSVVKIKGEKGDDGTGVNPNLLKQTEFESSDKLDGWDVHDGSISAAGTGGYKSFCGTPDWAAAYKELLQQAIYKSSSDKVIGTSQWHTLSFYAKGVPSVTQNINQTSALYGFATQDVYFGAGVTCNMTVRGKVSQAAINSGRYLRVYVYNDDWSFGEYLDISSATLVQKSISFTVPADGLYHITSYVYPNTSDGTAVDGETATVSYYRIDRGNTLCTYIYPSCIDTAQGCYADGVAASARADGFAEWQLTTDWVRHTFTFKTKSAISEAQYVLFRMAQASNGAYICMPKLEVGQQASAYMPFGGDLRTPYYEYRYAKNGSTTTPPTLDTTSAMPSGWTTAQPAVGELEYLWSTIAKKNSDGTLAENWSTPVRITPHDGAQGLQGCIIRTTEWQKGVSYRNDTAITDPDTIRYLDFAVIKSPTGAVEGIYQCLETHTATDDDKPGTGAGWQAKWAKSNQFTTPIYTPAILADKSAIQFMQGNQLLILNSEGKVCAGLAGAEWPLWIGGTTADEAPSKLRIDGSGSFASGDLTWEEDGDVRLAGFTYRKKRIVTAATIANYIEDGKPNVVKMGSWVSIEGAEILEKHRTLTFPSATASTEEGKGNSIDDFRALVGSTLRLYNNLDTETTPLKVSGLVCPNGFKDTIITLRRGYMLTAECTEGRRAGTERIYWKLKMLARAAATDSDEGFTITATSTAPSSVSGDRTSGTTVSFTFQLTDQYGNPYQPDSIEWNPTFMSSTSCTTIESKSLKNLDEGLYSVTAVLAYKSGNVASVTKGDIISLPVKVDGNVLSICYFKVFWTLASSDLQS